MGTTLVSARFVRCGCGATITPEQAVNARLVWPELCRECAGHVRTYIASVERRERWRVRRLGWEARFERVRAHERRMGQG